MPDPRLIVLIIVIRQLSMASMVTSCTWRQVGFGATIGMSKYGNVVGFVAQEIIVVA